MVVKNYKCVFQEYFTYVINQSYVSMLTISQSHFYILMSVIFSMKNTLYSFAFSRIHLSFNPSSHFCEEPWWFASLGYQHLCEHKCFWMKLYMCHPQHSAVLLRSLNVYLYLCPHFVLLFFWKTCQALKLLWNLVYGTIFFFVQLHLPLQTVYHLAHS